MEREELAKYEEVTRLLNDVNQIGQNLCLTLAVRKDSDKYKLLLDEVEVSLMAALKKVQVLKKDC